MRSLVPWVAAKGPISEFATADVLLGILHQLLGWNQSWWRWGGVTVPSVSPHPLGVPASPRSPHHQERPAHRTPVHLSIPPPIINSFTVPPQPCVGPLVAPGPLCPLSCLSPLQREECLGSCASLSPSAHHSQAGTVPGCPVGTPKPVLLLGGCSSTPHSGRLPPPCSSPGPRHGKQQLSRNFSEVCQTRATKPKPSPGTGTFLGAENATVT